MRRLWSLLSGNQIALALLVLYIVSALASLFIVLTGVRGQFINNFYGLLLGAIPLVGGFYGLLVLSPRWGGWRSALGKSVALLALGLVFWSIGTYIFSGYYNLLAEIDVPYPSLADVAYIISWPLWGMGIFFLSQATGAHFALRKTGGKAILFLIPIAIVIGSFYLLIHIARGGAIADDTDTLKAFFDLFYPIGDVVILTAATLIFTLSYNYFGGFFKVPIYLILFGFLLNYISDFSFSYATTLGTFYAGGPVDLLFATTMFVLALGISFLDPRLVTSA